MRTKVISCGICALMIASIFVIEIPKDVDAQVTEEWVVRYNGPANGQDVAEAIAIDSSGNVYVTGCSQGTVTGCDYSTIAYDPNGNELWAARYNSPGDGEDYACAMAVSSNGNIYVTGWSDCNPSYPGINTDYVTVAYDQNGNELWVARYNGPGNSVDDAYALATDPSGNVYVTGGSHSSSKSYDYATVKYDPDGNELWVARYDSPMSGYDHARAISVDSIGNVYVTGGSLGSDGQIDYTTLAYDSSGNELWVARYNGPIGGFDIARSIVVDPSGNVYVTGNSQGKVIDYDYATIAYDSSGKELWVARYDGPGNDWDVARDIAVDSSGNVYVTGKTGGNGTYYDSTTIAYNSNGNELWVARYNGPGDRDDAGTGIATDSSGNIYVTGWSDGSPSGVEFATIKYDSDGNELWVVRYKGRPVSNDDQATDIAIDLSGNVFVTGRSVGTGTASDYVTIKYSQKSILQATIDIDPDTLNLKSKGKWITAYIELPEGYDVNDIDISTVMLNDEIPAAWGDVQGTTLMVKFDRSEVEDMLSSGTYKLKVTGGLTDGTSFEGYSDEIRVIDPPKK